MHSVLNSAYFPYVLNFPLKLFSSTNIYFWLTNKNTPASQMKFPLSSTCKVTLMAHMDLLYKDYQKEDNICQNLELQTTAQVNIHHISTDKLMPKVTFPSKFLNDY